jgi:hypothetical protein
MQPEVSLSSLLQKSFTESHAKKVREMDVYIQIFLTWALVGGEWSASCPGHFTPSEKTLGTLWTGDSVGPRACLDDRDEEILDFNREPNHNSSTDIQSSYRLYYRGPVFQRTLIYVVKQVKNFHSGSNQMVND